MKHVILAIPLVALAACTQTGSGSVGVSGLQASCEALVAAETGTMPQDVRATSTQSSPTGTTTLVSVTGAAAPWLCRADASGVIIGVEYSQEG